MKVKVNMINTCCILVTEAVTVSNVITIASLVSEIWLSAKDRQTHRETDYLASSMLINLFKVFMTLKTKQKTDNSTKLTTAVQTSNVTHVNSKCKRSINNYMAPRRMQLDPVVSL